MIVTIRFGFVPHLRVRLDLWHWTITYASARQVRHEAAIRRLREATNG